MIFICSSITAAAQQDEQAGRVSPKELSIPASPIFDMMGVAASQITRTSSIKDFKVDWSFKSWKLNPNLTIQSQPVWELFYNRKELDKYQEAGSFMRRLSSLDISIGSVQNEEGDRRIGFAGKMNLYTEKDPLMAKEIFEGIPEKYEAEKKQLETQLKELNNKLDTTQKILEKPGIRSQVKSTEEQLNTINSRRREEINGNAKIFVSENWNASSLDFAYGRVYTYKTDSLGGLKGLRLNRNTGWSAWLNGSLGIGKKLLLSGLFRTSWYEEELNFLVKNTTTLEESSQKAVADNKLYSMGLNLRYGGALYTFFVEFLYEKKALKTAAEALNEAFKAPGNSIVVSSSVKWDIVHPNTFSIGGDWRISRSVILNYGMRCVYDAKWKFKTFAPIATVSCMMR
jgi:hypothetical protein